VVKGDPRGLPLPSPGVFLGAERPRCLMWQFFKQFLKEAPDSRALWRERFAAFQRLLQHNHQALAVMAELEELTAETPAAYREAMLHQLDHLEGHILGLVTEMHHLAPGRYDTLAEVGRHLVADIRQELAEVPAIPETPYILPLQAITRESAPAVGAKMANLGEIRTHLGLPVPRGFAITAQAYQAFMEQEGLGATIDARLSRVNPQDLEDLESASREIQAMIRATPLPRDLEEILRLTAEALPTPRLALRSSAVGEDTDFSFAGQFTTLLNITVGQLAANYKTIIAGKFTPQAIFYALRHGFASRALPMAVGVLAMVRARAGGVLFTLDPHHPDHRTVIINGVWGLGKFAVDGVITPDLFVVAREGERRILTQRVSPKTLALTCRKAGGCRELRMPPDQAHAPCLTPSQVLALTDMALTLERHFGCPQDVEWALDQDQRLVILQSRPLRLMAPTAAVPEGAAPAPEKEVEPRWCGGIRAVGGAAAGTVFVLARDADIGAIPDGAIVLARQPALRLVMVMDRINAIITEAGSPTDHLTILAREFRVPTLVGAAGVTKVLAPGELVTVDADHCKVYPGVRVELLQKRRSAPGAGRDDPEWLHLKRLLQRITSLHLLDPEAPEFSPDHCQTLHDLTRFCHEKAMDAMFALKTADGRIPAGVSRLRTTLPFTLFLLDLGGGLAASDNREVTEEDILSQPLKALLRGFQLHQRSRGQGMPFDLKGFMSVWANTMYDHHKAEGGLGGSSFAVISDNYLNFSSRLGYHFGHVDAYLSQDTNDNYVTFQFKGGAAGLERRARRARLIQEILEELGFRVYVTGDLVQARLVKFPFAESARILERVAVLMAFCRQLDLALASDAALERCLAAFREEDYSLSCLGSA
jgi:pyruvate,water dikinase